MGFNVFDFQGKMANYDFKMIKDLFEWLPNTYLLVQVDEADFLQRLEQGVGNEDTFEKMKQRMIILSNARVEDKRKEIEDSIK